MLFLLSQMDNMKLHILNVFLLGLLLTNCGGSKLPAFLEAEAEAEKKVEEAKKINDQVKQLSAKETELKDTYLKKKYADMVNVSPEEIENVKLYGFIDSWMGTPYLMGGENKKGIDCSFFAQFLYHDVYNSLIERTAEKQYRAKSTAKFTGLEYLEEGDLLFFNLTGSIYAPITHVGVYLQNGKFVHSTSRRTPKGNNGVQIGNIYDRHWQKLFVAAGRKAIKK